MGISAHLTQSGAPRQARLIVDSRDTVQTMRGINVRPGEDRIEYCQILDVANQIVLPEVELDFSSEYYGMEPSRNDRLIYRLEQCGFYLELTQWAEPVSQALRWHTEKVVERLYDICNLPDADPLLFVGGKIDDRGIRDALTQLMRTRDVHLLCFARRSKFAVNSLRPYGKLATLADLVDWRLANQAVYRGIPGGDLSDDGRTASRPLPDPANDNPVPELPATSLAAALQAAGVPSAEDLKTTAPSPELPETARSKHEPSAPPSDDADTENGRLLDKAYDNDALYEYADDGDVPKLVLIDVENIDTTVGQMLEGSSLAKRFEKPLNPITRLQWDRLIKWLEERGEVFAVPVLVAHNDDITSFAAYLSTLGYRPWMVRPDAGTDVVDRVIRRLLERMTDREGSIIVISHDGGYLEQLEHLRDSDPERRITVAGFIERMNRVYRECDWIEVLDLERDMNLFVYPLPNRYLPVDVDDLNADALLDEAGLFQRFESEEEDDDDND